MEKLEEVEEIKEEEWRELFKVASFKRNIFFMWRRWGVR